MSIKIMKSEYIRISKTIIRKLYDVGCFGEGSLYIHPLKDGLSPNDSSKVEDIIDSLVKQEIIIKKKKQHGWKYYLNKERLDKIREIIGNIL